MVAVCGQVLGQRWVPNPGAYSITPGMTASGAVRAASGELYSLFVAVDALALGEQGRDSLGCCHVNSATAEKELLETMADHGMIEQACTDLIERIQGKATLLSRFAV